MKNLFKKDLFIKKFLKPSANYLLRLFTIIIFSLSSLQNAYAAIYIDAPGTYAINEYQFILNQGAINGNVFIVDGTHTPNNLVGVVSNINGDFSYNSATNHLYLELLSNSTISGDVTLTSDNNFVRLMVPYSSHSQSIGGSLIVDATYFEINLPAISSSSNVSLTVGNGIFVTASTSTTINVEDNSKLIITSGDIDLTNSAKSTINIGNGGYGSINIEDGSLKFGAGNDVVNSYDTGSGSYNFILADQIDFGAGADEINVYGGGFSIQEFVSSGDIFMGEGNDSININASSLVIHKDVYMGNGDDVLKNAGYFSIYNLDMGDDNDRIQLEAGASGSISVITLTMGDGNDIIDIASNYLSVRNDLNVFNGISMGAGDDEIKGAAVDIRFTSGNLNMGEGANIIGLTAGIIDVNNGNIEFGTGADILKNTSGISTVTATAVNFGDGANVIDVDAGDLTVNGAVTMGVNNDIIDIDTGGSLIVANPLDMGDGANRIDLVAGNVDVQSGNIEFGSGIDTLTNTSGTSTVTATAVNFGDGANVIDVDAGELTVNGAVTMGVNNDIIDIDTGGSLIVANPLDMGDGANRIDLVAGNVDVQSGNIEFGSGIDTLTNTSGISTVTATAVNFGDGDDLIAVNGGTFDIDGIVDMGNDNDTIDMAGGQLISAQAVSMGLGDDQIKGAGVDIQITLGDLNMGEDLNSIDLVAGNVDVQSGNIEFGSGIDTLTNTSGTSTVTATAVNFGDGANVIDVDAGELTVNGAVTMGVNNDIIDIDTGGSLIVANPLDMGDGANRIDVDASTLMATGAVTMGDGDDQISVSSGSSAEFTQLDLGIGNHTIATLNSSSLKFENITATGSGNDNITFSDASIGEITAGGIIDLGDGDNLLKIASTGDLTVQNVDLNLTNTDLSLTNSGGIKLDAGQGIGFNGDNNVLSFSGEGRILSGASLGIVTGSANTDIDSDSIVLDAGTYLTYTMIKGGNYLDLRATNFENIALTNSANLILEENITETGAGGAGISDIIKVILDEDSVIEVSEIQTQGLIIDGQGANNTFRVGGIKWIESTERVANTVSISNVEKVFVIANSILDSTISSNSIEEIIITEGSTLTIGTADINVNPIIKGDQDSNNAKLILPINSFSTSNRIENIEEIIMDHVEGEQTFLIQDKLINIGKLVYGNGIEKKTIAIEETNQYSNDFNGRSSFTKDYITSKAEDVELNGRLKYIDYIRVNEFSASSTLTSQLTINSDFVGVDNIIVGTNIIGNAAQARLQLNGTSSSNIILNRGTLGVGSDAVINTSILDSSSGELTYSVTNVSVGGNSYAVSSMENDVKLELSNYKSGLIITDQLIYNSDNKKPIQINFELQGSADMFATSDTTVVTILQAEHDIDLSCFTINAPFLSAVLAYDNGNKKIVNVLYTPSQLVSAVVSSGNNHVRNIFNDSIIPFIASDKTDQDLFDLFSSISTKYNDNTSSQTALATIEELLPNIDNSATVVAVQTTARMLDNIESRVTSRIGTGAITSISTGDNYVNNSLWGEVLYNYSKLSKDKKDNLPGFSANSYTAMLGYDMLNDINSEYDHVFGILFGYQYSDINHNFVYDDRSNKGKQENYYGTIYNSLNFNKLTMGANLTYGMIDSEKERFIGELNKVANAQYNSHLFSIGLNAQYSFDQAIFSKNIELEPTIKVNYSYIKNEDYTETGAAGSANLYVRQKNQSGTRFELGNRFTYKSKYKDLLIKSSLYLGGIYDNIKNQKANVSFVRARNYSFALESSALSRFGGVVNLDFDIAVGDRYVVNVGSTMESKKNYNSYSIYLGSKFLF